MTTRALRTGRKILCVGLKLPKGRTSTKALCGEAARNQPREQLQHLPSSGLCSLLTGDYLTTSSRAAVLR